MSPRILWILFITHLAIGNSIDCVDKSGSGTSSDNDSQHIFTVNIATNCSTSSLIIDITYSGYNGNWFGIVFSETMTGGGNASALVYTTGKPNEQQRPTALYSYRLSSKARDASGVTYNGANSDPKKLSTQTTNNTLQLTYSWTPPRGVFNPNTMPFMWARGDTDHQLTFHEDRAHDPVMITLSTLVTTTVSPVNISNITEPETTMVKEVKCGFIVLESHGESLARPLDVCTNSFDSNGSTTQSMMITCEDNVFIRKVFDDDSCNGTVNETDIETLGHDCIEGADCVCGAGSECDYATWTRYVDDEGDANGTNETCDGASYIEMAVVLNACTNGIMYECAANDTLLYEICDEGGSNTTEQKTVCDLECNEGEVIEITTTQMPEIESTLGTTEGIETTALTPAPTVSESKSKKTVIIVGSVIGAFFFVLIVIGVCLFCINRKDKSGKEQGGYGAVGGNETGNETDGDVEIVEMPVDTR
eukprot:46551_1